MEPVTFQIGRVRVVDRNHDNRFRVRHGDELHIYNQETQAFEYTLVDDVRVRNELERLGFNQWAFRINGLYHAERMVQAELLEQSQNPNCGETYQLVDGQYIAVPVCDDLVEEAFRHAEVLLEAQKQRGQGSYLPIVEAVALAYTRSETRRDELNHPVAFDQERAERLIGEALRQYFVQGAFGAMERSIQPDNFSSHIYVASREALGAGLEISERDLNRYLWAIYRKQMTFHLELAQDAAQRNDSGDVISAVHDIGWFHGRVRYTPITYGDLWDLIPPCEFEGE